MAQRGHVPGVPGCGYTPLELLVHLGLGTRHPCSRVSFWTYVFTGRVDGPCSRVVWTGAREHG